MTQEEKTKIEERIVDVLKTVYDPEIPVNIWDLGIDSRTKQVLFSNALDTDRAIEIQQYAQAVCQPSFGIGTHFTNDFAGIEPLNIVIKLVAAKITESWPYYNDTCKLSEDLGKHTGKPEVIARFMQALHMKGHEA